MSAPSLLIESHQLSDNGSYIVHLLTWMTFCIVYSAEEQDIPKPISSSEEEKDATETVTAASRDHQVISIDILKDHFLMLCFRIASYLIEKGCTVDTLRVCFSDFKRLLLLPSTSRADDDINSSTDISNFLLNVKCNSILDCGFLKHVALTMCPDSVDISNELNEYEVLHQQYMTTPLLDSCYLAQDRYLGSKHMKLMDSVEVELSITELWTEQTPLERLISMEATLARAFRCASFHLFLRRIDLQSLKLSYEVMSDCDDDIFPLTIEEWREIAEQGVAELKCKTFHYFNPEKGRTYPCSYAVYKIYHYTFNFSI